MQGRLAAEIRPRQRPWRQEHPESNCRQAVQLVLLTELGFCGSVCRYGLLY
eukprot:SAG31_NODE_40906_length_278_cov_1.139665_1_plen_50_part_01